MPLATGFKKCSHSPVLWAGIIFPLSSARGLVGQYNPTHSCKFKFRGYPKLWFKNDLEHKLFLAPRASTSLLPCLITPTSRRLWPLWVSSCPASMLRPVLCSIFAKLRIFFHYVSHFPRPSCADIIQVTSSFPPISQGQSLCLMQPLCGCTAWDTSHASHSWPRPP